ncbi:MAG: hypothetical protein WAV40_03030 [Microgenomates group bacterium]
MKNVVINNHCGKISGEARENSLAVLPQRGTTRVVHIMHELFTKLSTGFCTAIKDIYPRIHRLYYYNYFI